MSDALVKNSGYIGTTSSDRMPNIRSCFFRLNEVSNEVKEVFKKLEIPLPKGVIGINPLP
jgi:hypothetical protein